MIEYADRLSAAMNASGVTTTALAKAMGVSYQAVKRVLEGKSKAFTAANNSEAARILGVSARWLAMGRGHMRDEDASADGTLEHVGSAPAAKRVPVAGMARMGDDGWYEVVEVLGSAGYVEAYSADRDAYALQVRGDSMFPAIRDSWYVVVEPHATAHPGEYVAIALRDGKKLVKELLFETDAGIVVQSVNGGVRLTISREDVATLHPIGGVLMPSKHRDH